MDKKYLGNAGKYLNNTGKWISGGLGVGFIWPNRRNTGICRRIHVR